jgi:hypothetical protein
VWLHAGKDCEQTTSDDTVGITRDHVLLATQLVTFSHCRLLVLVGETDSKFTPAVHCVSDVLQTMSDVYVGNTGEYVVVEHTEIGFEQTTLDVVVGKTDDQFPSNTQSVMLLSQARSVDAVGAIDWKCLPRTHWVALWPQTRSEVTVGCAER